MMQSHQSARVATWARVLMLSVCLLVAVRTYAQDDRAEFERRTKEFNEQQAWFERDFQRPPPATPEERVSRVLELSAHITANIKKTSNFGIALNMATMNAAQLRLTPGVPARETAAAVRLLAELQAKGGQHADALASYREVLALQLTVVPSDESALADTRRGLSVLLRAQGAFAEADEQLRLAHLGSTGGYDAQSAATKMMNLADAAASTDPRAAAKWYGEAVSLLSQEAPESSALATLYSRQGMHALSTEDRATAISAFTREVPLRARLAAKPGMSADEATAATYMSAMAIGNLGGALLSMGRCDEASDRARATLALLDPTHPSVISTRELLASAEACRGDFGAANRELDTLARSFSAPESHEGPVYVRYLDTRIDVLWTQGKTAEARAALEAEGPALRKISAAAIDQGTDDQAKELWRRRLRRYADRAITMSVQGDRPDPVAATLGYEALLHYKGRLLDAQGLTLSNIRSGRDSWLRTQLQTRELHALVLRSQRSGVFEKEATPPELNTALIQHGLKAGQALLEFAVYRPMVANAATQPPADAHYVAYVLRAEGPVSAVGLGPVTHIDELVHSALQTLASDGPAYRSIARHLFAILFAPLLPALQDSVMISICPDAALNLLPFAALLDADDQYLLRRYQIHYLTSSRDLIHFDHSLIPRQKPRLFFAPDLNAKLPHDGSPRNDPDTAGFALARYLPRLGPLPGARREANAVARVLKVKKDAMFVGARASEQALEGLHGPSILHIASHGFFVDEAASNSNEGGAAKPKASDRGVLAEYAAASARAPAPVTLPPLQRSGLLMAGANRKQTGHNDGIVTAQELMALDLQGTQLVTLSACDTGLGPMPIS